MGTQTKPTYAELEQGLRQMYVLLDNALDAMPGRPSISITIQRKPPGEILAVVDSDVAIPAVKKLLERLDANR